MKSLSIAALTISIISTMIAVFLFLRLRQLECDIGSGFSAERKFTYPMFRELGKNPDDYGKEVRNPLMSASRYFHCVN